MSGAVEFKELDVEAGRGHHHHDHDHDHDDYDDHDHGHDHGGRGAGAGAGSSKNGSRRRTKLAALRAVVSHGSKQNQSVKRYSQVLKKQKRLYLQSKFQPIIFIRYFLYHQLFPLLLPLAWWYDGTIAVANFTFFFSWTPGVLLNTWVFTLTCWVMTIGTSYISDVRIEWIVRIALGAFAARNVLIALKYALLSKNERILFRTTRLTNEEMGDWLMSSWGAPAPRLLQKQLRQAALERNLEACESHQIWFDRTNQRELEKELLIPDVPSIKLGDGKISILSFTLSVLLDATRKHKLSGTYNSITFVILSFTPLAFWASIVMDWINGQALQLTAIDISLGILGTMSFLYYSTIMVLLLRVGIADFARRAYALKRLNELIQERAVVTVDAKGLPHSHRVRPLLTVWFSHNIRLLLGARTMLKNVGRMYSIRIQVIIGLFAILFVGLIAVIVLLSIVEYQLAGVITAICVVNLVVFAAAVVSMILSGGAANAAKYDFMQALLEAQRNIISVYQQKTNPEFVAAVAKRRESFIKCVDDAGEDTLAREAAATVNPLQRSGSTPINLTAKQLVERAVRGDDFVIDPRLNDLSATELRNTAHVVEHAISQLQQQELLTPITFLGLTAGPTLLRTIVTLSVSAASVGLRSVFQAVFAWFEERLHSPS